MKEGYKNYSKQDLARRLAALQEIAVDLLKAQDPHDLLELIVSHALKIMICDAGSLYLKGEDDELIFEVAKNNSLSFEFEKLKVSTNSNGVAVYTFNNCESINIADVKQLPEGTPYSFNVTFDEKSHYRTKSVLTQPLRRSDGELLGVIQLMNRKNNNQESWPSDNENAISEMPSFCTDDQNLLASFAALASAAIENAQLHKEVSGLLEGFVRASVNAIEVRDTATCGHSERVATLSCSLAEMVNRSQESEHRDIYFTDKQVKELEYASLLHDFGKIGVREEVLLKQEKLYPIDKLKIEMRMNEVGHAGEVRLLREYLTSLITEQRVPTEFEMAQLNRKVKQFRGEIRDVWEEILTLNKTAILDEKNDALIQKLLKLQYEDREGQVLNVITQEEADFLSIARGSISDDERDHINSHVSNTYDFLKQIPWTKDFRNVADIAHAHHEKLDGSGYPLRLKSDQIPAQSKIMTIIDIFDALVAMDRPYKRAVPLEKALDILWFEANNGKLDKSFMKVFTDAKVYENNKFKKLMQVSVAKMNAKKSCKKAA